MLTHQPADPPGAQTGAVPRPGWRATLLWLSVGFAVAAVVASLATRSIDAPEVPVGVVARKDLSAWISTNGKVEPIEPQVVVARTDTFVREVFVTPGAAVTAGQPLLTLDAADLRAQLARTREEHLAAQQQMRSAMAGGSGEELARVESDLQQTEAELAKLRRDRDSLQHLVDKQAATRDELAQSALALERAEAEEQFLVRKRANLQLRAGSDAERAGLLTERARQTMVALEDQLRSTEVVAAAAGTVYSLPVAAGQHVHIGDTLAEVADLRHVRIRAFVDEPELGSVASGQPVVIAWDALAGRSWAGRTVQIPSTVVPRGGRSVGEVFCSVDNDDMKLLPNINVDVRVRTDDRPHALTVPRSAVRIAGESRYVFLVKDQRIKRQSIRVGVSSTSEYEVLQGLCDGDLVALDSDVELRDGMIVRSVAR
jgi:HlyD family secretion protein